MIQNLSLAHRKTIRFTKRHISPKRTPCPRKQPWHHGSKHPHPRRPARVHALLADPKTRNKPTLRLLLIHRYTRKSDLLSAKPRPRRPRPLIKIAHPNRPQLRPGHPRPPKPPVLQVPAGQNRRRLTRHTADNRHTHILNLARFTPSTPRAKTNHNRALISKKRKRLRSLTRPIRHRGRRQMRHTICKL